jgi:hypothetical protein
MIPTPAWKTNLPVSPGTTEVPPLPMRVYSLDVSAYPGLQSAYWVSFWSYRFFILRENIEVPRRTQRQAIAKWLKNTNGAKELTHKGVAAAYASSVMILDDVNDSPVFLDQLSKVRKLKFATELKRSR